MIYKIIHEASLDPGYSTSVPGGYRVHARVNRPNKLTVEPGALQAVVPAEANIAAVLLASYTPAEADLFSREGHEPHIVVSVEARYGDESKSVVIAYLLLLEAWLRALAGNGDPASEVLDHVAAWGGDLWNNLKSVYRR